MVNKRFISNSPEEMLNFYFFQSLPGFIIQENIQDKKPLSRRQGHFSLCRYGTSWFQLLSARSLRTQPKRATWLGLDHRGHTVAQQRRTLGLILSDPITGFAWVDLKIIKSDQP
jgi:hypothetical protein